MKFQGKRVYIRKLVLHISNNGNYVVTPTHKRNFCQTVQTAIYEIGNYVIVDT